jgi:hypothetical protein
MLRTYVPALLFLWRVTRLRHRVEKDPANQNQKDLATSALENELANPWSFTKPQKGRARWPGRPGCVPPRRIPEPLRRPRSRRAAAAQNRHGGRRHEKRGRGPLVGTAARTKLRTYFLKTAAVTDPQGLAPHDGSEHDPLP